MMFWVFMLLNLYDLFDVCFLFIEEECVVQVMVVCFIDEWVLLIIGDVFDQGCFFDELIFEIVVLGLFGFSLFEQYGGGGFNVVSYGLICQELECGDFGLCSFVLVQSLLCMYLIFVYGSEEQCLCWLFDMVVGKVIGCFGLIEVYGGLDLVVMKIWVVCDGGDWVVNGSKMWIISGLVVDIVIVWVYIEDGIQGFVLEKGMFGFSIQEIKYKMSLCVLFIGVLFFDNVCVFECNCLFNVQGLKGLLGCFNQVCYGISWGLIGVVVVCLDEVLNYIKQCVLFGCLVVVMQSVQIKLVDMVWWIIIVQLLLLQLGCLKDVGQLQLQQVSLVKWNNCWMVIDIVCECCDLFGGVGIIIEYVVIWYVLNLELVIIYEGIEIVYQLVIGCELIGINVF